MHRRTKYTQFCIIFGRWIVKLIDGMVHGYEDDYGAPAMRHQFQSFHSGLCTMGEDTALPVQRDRFHSIPSFCQKVCTPIAKNDAQFCIFFLVCIIHTSWTYRSWLFFQYSFIADMTDMVHKTTSTHTFMHSSRAMKTTSN